jgi:hypothetical protein
MSTSRSRRYRARNAEAATSFHRPQWWKGDGDVVEMWNLGKDVLTMTNGHNRCPKCDNLNYYPWGNNVGLNSIWLWLTSMDSNSNDRKSPAKSQPLDRSPMQVTGNFIELLDGDPPPGAEVHTLLSRPHWRPDKLGDYRTIKVTRTDGST